jgi:uroporphyrinogen-III synthase
MSQAIKMAIEQIHTYDWIIFTSSVTVETFFFFCENGKKLPKVAVIGDKTKEAIERENIFVDFTPREFVAEGFVKEFLPHVSEGTRVLIPKGNLAREYIASSLMEKGAHVDELIIYETYMPDESKSRLLEVLSGGKLDILTFTSPSTIDHFMETVKGKQLDSVINQCIIACIGPVSRRRAEQYGLTVHACPESYTAAEMLESVIEYLNKK